MISNGRGAPEFDVVKGAEGVKYLWAVSDKSARDLPGTMKYQ